MRIIGKRIRTTILFYLGLSLLLAPISAIAAPYTTDIACTTGQYHVEAGEVTKIGSESCTGVVTIGAGITKILTDAFLDNTAITDVISTSTSLESIGDQAFKGNTNLQSLQLANGIFWIGTFSFQNDISLSTIDLGTHLGQINLGAFRGCTGITSLTLPNSLTSIGGSAFSGATHLTSIVIPNSVTSVGTSAFSGASALSSVTLGNGLTTLSALIFQNDTHLTSVTFGTGITSIGANAFSNNILLASITIPSGVISIGVDSFSGTTALTSFTYCGHASLTGTGLIGKTRISCVPGAPTIGAATSTGTTTATVAFIAPVSDGGSTILTYVATSSPGSVTATLTQAGSGTISITGLSPTTSYTFTVIAHNAIGDSVASSASNSITTSTPTTVPDAPTIGVATSTGTTTATVAFTAPGSNGGSTILTYTATSSPGSITATLTQAGSGTISITGLSATTSYTFTVIAHNAIGDSVASSASNSITTATPALAAPGSVTVTGLNAAEVEVAFTAPASNGGSVITSYTIISIPAKVTATLYQAGGGSVIFSGLEGGTNYTFSVVAHTALGDSPEAISSSGVIMPAYIPIAQMLPILAPSLASNGAALVCSIGTYSQSATASIFSLFIDGKHVSTIFSAVGDYLPDWIIDWATPGTISRTATLTSASWLMQPSWAGKKMNCLTVAYANNAIGIINSNVLAV